MDSETLIHRGKHFTNAGSLVLLIWDTEQGQKKTKTESLKERVVTTKCSTRLAELLFIDDQDFTTLHLLRNVINFKRRQLGLLRHVGVAVSLSLFAVSFGLLVHDRLFIKWI